MYRYFMTFLAVTMLGLTTSNPAMAEASEAVVEKEPAATVLFIRGADRSGGFLEAKSDAQRTSQLADIKDETSKKRNHGWATLAETLSEAGFDVTQITESVEADAGETGPTVGVAVPLAEMDLSKYDVIVFGSNNASYDKPAVDAVEKYLRDGGGVIFISDANFGGHWADASNSDQPFLDRLGLVANQDRGTYVLRRDKDEFASPDHPILQDVDAFDGEGVTPVTVKEKLPKDVSIEILACAKGQVRRNDKPDKAGSTSKAEKNDAVLAAGTMGDGRFVWHFDRNTFFNKGGAGTDITRFDNEKLAINLFRWVTSGQ